MRSEMRLTGSFNYPGFIQFFPTMECNRTCDYCFNRGYRSGPGISISDYRRLIEAMAGAGVREIDILGGEPTLHPDLAGLIEIAVRSGLKVFLSSNGSNTELLSQLARSYGAEALVIGVSLHGEVPGALHEFITRCRPVLKSVCPENVEVPEVAGEYVESGMEYRLIYRDTVFPNDLAGMVPFHEFFRQLQTLKIKYPNVRGVYCQGFISGEGHPFPGRVRCPAGTTKVSILPDGSVYPCYLFIRNKEFMLGNILTGDFRTIMSSPALSYFRESRKNKCPDTQCSLHPACRGGCPAVSLLIHGDLDAPDPRCVYR